MQNGVCLAGYTQATAQGEAITVSSDYNDTLHNFKIFAKAYQDNYKVGALDKSMVQLEDGLSGTEMIVTSDVDCTVTRCGRNLFDTSKINEIVKPNVTNRPYTGIAVGKVTTNANLYNVEIQQGFIFHCSKNTDYMFSFVYETNFEQTTAVTIHNDTTRLFSFYNKNSFKFNSGDNEILYIQLYNSKSTQPRYCEATFSNIQLEFGSTATPYEPYQGQAYQLTANTPTKIPLLDGVNTVFSDTGNIHAEYRKAPTALPTPTDIIAPTPTWDSDVIGSNVASLKLNGKNLFGGIAFANKIKETVPKSVLNETDKTISYDANGISGKTIIQGIFKEKTQYTIMLNGKNLSVQSPTVTNLVVRYTDGTGQSIYFGKPYVTDVNKTVESIKGVWVTLTSVARYEECGIFEGVLTEKDFAPYSEQAIPLNWQGNALPVPSSYPNPTYVDENGQGWIADEWNNDGTITRRIGKYIFTGNEDISAYLSGSTVLYFLTASNIVNAKDKACISNCFVGSETVSDADGKVSVNSIGNRMFFSYRELKNADEFKAFLKSKYDSGNPVYVDYILKDPITEAFTFTPIKIKHGYNRIYTQGTGTTPKIEMNYKQIM